VRCGWKEEPTPYGAPRWLTHAGGVLSFEPGGQIEYSSPPAPSVELVLRAVAATLAPLHEAARPLGVELVFAGVDPHNPLDRVPLQLDGERYRRMDAYFARLGPAGAAMMRQTAALQVNVDAGDTPLKCWRVLNAAAPVLLAMFANSPRYAGADTAHGSWRAHLWRELDPARTGIRGAGPDAVEEYLHFALAAPWIMRAAADHDQLPFGTWLAEGAVTLDDWRLHLTTLFPEVRPRGYFELRALDSVAPALLAAPLVLVAGLVADPAALDAAGSILPAPTPEALRRAGRLGVHDPRTRRLAEQLADVALVGYARAYPASEKPLDVARRFVSEWTRRGRSPADRPLTPATSLAGR
jgi:glutamate--cysteine ligase